MNKLSNAVTLPFLCCICSGIISFSNSFSVRLASSIDTAYFHFVAFFILYNSRHLLLQRYRNISIIGTSRDSSLECKTAEAQGPDAARRALDDHKRRKKQNSDRTVTFFAMPSTHWQSLSYRELLAPIENSIFSFCQRPGDSQKQVRDQLQSEDDSLDPLATFPIQLCRGILESRNKSETGQKHTLHVIFNLFNPSLLSIRILRNFHLSHSTCS